MIETEDFFGLHMDAGSPGVKPDSNEQNILDQFLYNNSNSNNKSGSNDKGDAVFTESSSMCSDNLTDLILSNLKSTNNMMNTYTGVKVDEKRDSKQAVLYEESLQIMRSLKFGGFSVKDELDLKIESSKQMEIPPNLFLPEEALLWDPAQNDADDYPYKLNIEGLPDFSRVETQIKVDISIYPRPEQSLLHLGSNLIAKRKLCLKDELTDDLKSKMLSLDCYVIAETDNTSGDVSPELEIENDYLEGFLKTDKFRSCNICSKCIKREVKRASRRKNGLSEDGLNWIDVIPKKAIIFNTKEVVCLPPPSETPKVEFSARIVCYCRHHNAKRGFKLLFLLSDHKGKILGKSFSKNISIMDRKKATDGITASATEEEAFTNGVNMKKRKPMELHSPITPPSLDESSSDAKSTKRAKMNSMSSVMPPQSFRHGFDNNFELVSFSPSSENRSPDDSSAIMTSMTSVPSPTMVKPQMRSQISSPPVSQNVQQSQSQFQQQTQHIQRPQMVLTQSSQQQSVDASSSVDEHFFAPQIQKVIPNEGPIRGGIAVTLLGRNFRRGLVAKFGENRALGTQFWSEETIVTYLPAATYPGQVLVTFAKDEMDPNGVEPDNSGEIFTYTDDTDRQLIELALQIVGLKMNGKLEDARNIARRIVGSDKPSGDNSPLSGSSGSPQEHKSFCDEDLVLNLVELGDLKGKQLCNWQLCNKESQTLLHMASFKGLTRLASALINRGARVDTKDINGNTPLHFAALRDHQNVIKLLFKSKANGLIKNLDGKTAINMSQNLQTRALISELSHDKPLDDLLNGSKLGSSSSLSSLSSLESSGNRDNFRIHVSKMVPAVFELNDSDADDEEESEILSDGKEAAGPLIDDLIASVANCEPEAKKETSKALQTQEECEVQEEPANDDDLPLYDDLYPEEELNKKALYVQQQQQQQLEEVSAETTVVSTDAETEEQESGRSQVVQKTVQENMREYYVYLMEKNQMTNDRMLWFFWVPLLVIIGSFYVYSQFCGIESLNKYGEQVADYTRELLCRVMIGKREDVGLVQFFIK